LACEEADSGILNDAVQEPDSPAPRRRRLARRADALDTALAGDLVRLRDSLTFLRLRHGLTQKQVARVLGIEQSNVSRVEVGGAGNIRVGTLARLAAVLGARLRLSLEVVPPLRKPLARVDTARSRAARARARRKGA
jgi:predicted XRE-type DNA-binding protein